MFSLFAESLRHAGWLPADDPGLNAWLKSAIEEGETSRRDGVPLHPAAQEFKTFIERDNAVDMGLHQMLVEQKIKAPRITTVETLVDIFNKIIQEAPSYGVISSPFSAVLLHAMYTQSGYSTFLNIQLNGAFKKLFDVWARLLSSPESCHVLHDGLGGWLSPPALAAVEENFGGLKFAEIYNCDPTEPHFGYTSWDHFFRRTLRDGIRPVEEPENSNIINAPCESLVYRVAHDVAERDAFWIKGSPFSISHMLNHDDYSSEFSGGTVMQGFLRTAWYHRWTSPVMGTVKKIVQVPGTYFCLAPTTLQEPEDIRLLASQPFMSCVATRMLIFIESEDPRIGLMCFIAIGMAEISTCEATVEVGQKVQKGDDIGMFHYGGSSHALVFRKGTKLRVCAKYSKPGAFVPVNAALAELV